MTKPKSADSLLVAAPEVARLLQISERSVWKQLAAGRIPRPVALGRCKRWRVVELREWLAAGAPDRETWEARI